MMNNEPQFKIFGKERRALKKELSGLKSHVKNFWWYHQLDKDMASFYGGTDTYPMSDDLATKKFNKTKEEVLLIEEQLLVPYT